MAKLALFAAACLAAVTLSEGVLAVSGFPRERPGRIAHPPNYDEWRSTLEFEYQFRTNAHGLRYRDVPLEKPAGTTGCCCWVTPSPKGTV